MAHFLFTHRQIVRHTHRYEKIDINHICTVCEKEFSRDDSLKRHIKEVHYITEKETKLVIDSDEHTENVHFRLRQFSERHQYDVKQLGSPAQMKKQHKMITHWNSNNI